MSTVRPDRPKRPKVPGFRSMLDYFMAGLMLLFGIFVMASEKIIGYNYFEDSAIVQGAMKYVIGVLLIGYGVMRAYRAYFLSKEDNG